MLRCRCNTAAQQELILLANWNCTGNYRKWDNRNRHKISQITRFILHHGNMSNTHEYVKKKKRSDDMIPSIGTYTNIKSFVSVYYFFIYFNSKWSCCYVHVTNRASWSSSLSCITLYIGDSFAVLQSHLTLDKKDKIEKTETHKSL